MSFNAASGNDDIPHREPELAPLFQSIINCRHHNLSLQDRIDVAMISFLTWRIYDVSRLDDRLMTSWARASLNMIMIGYSLQWRHNECDTDSNQRRFYCLLKRLFRRKSKKTSKLRVTGLCEGNSLVTGDFPAQRTSNTESVPIWWRHHVQSTPDSMPWQFSTHYPHATLVGSLMLFVWQ